jgi:ribose-phosphate pyrophosphokinase
LIDDIVSSSRTMAVAAAQVGEVFGRPPVCLGVHAVFAPDALQVLKDAGAGRIVTCNTLPHETNAIDVTGDIAGAVRQFTTQRTKS